MIPNKLHQSAEEIYAANQAANIQGMRKDANINASNTQGILEEIRDKEVPEFPTEIATKTEIVGNRDEVASAFFSMLRGDKGDQGEVGPMGPQGEQGPQGESGQSIEGPQGVQGLTGEKGEQGEKGETGDRGLPGEDGNDGKDGSPDTGDEIIGKINEAENSILPKKIDGLEKMMKSVEDRDRNPVGGAIGVGGGPSKLKDLQDVRISSPTDNQSLTYDSATGKWVNETVSGGGGGTVDTIVAGNNIDVDATDPANPIVSVETLTLADISDVTASATELNYVDGVTSAIQTQINAKPRVTVGATGDYSTINDAVTALGANGGKIYLMPGSYAPCTLASNIWLEGDSNGKSIISVPNSSQANGVLISGLTNVRVSNIRVYGNKLNVDTGGTLYLTINGILVTASSNVIIDNNYCYECYYGGVAVDTSTNVIVNNNHCVDNRDNGIFVRPDNTNITIYGNTVNGSSYSGIQALHSDYVNIYGNISYDNGPTSAEGDGIGFEGCRYSRIANNIIYSNGIQGIKVDYTVEGSSTQRSLDCIVENNVIYDHADTGNGCGIEVLRSDNITLRNNRIKTCKYGINVGEVIGINIFGNEISGSTSHGIRCHDSASTGKILIDGNKITGAGSHGIETFQDRVRITNNIVSGGSDQGIRLSDGNNYYIEGNTVFDNANNGILVSSGAGAVEVRQNEFYNTAAAQDRALYEESGGGPTAMVGNKISGQATAPFELSHASSYSIADGIFGTDITVPDEAYGVGWNGSLEVPTKNAIYDAFTAGGVGDIWVEKAGDTMTGALSIGVAGNALTLKNSTDNASVQVAIFEGDRATPAVSDSAYITLRLSDSAGNQDEFARIAWNISTVTSGSEVGYIDTSLINNGSLSLYTRLSNASFRCGSNDQITLGNSSVGWADLFLASGGVINWNSGDVTLTHASNVLSFAGASSGYNFDADINITRSPSASFIKLNGSGGTVWSIGLGSETINYLYIGGGTLATQYFWRANWSDTSLPGNTFKSASNTAGQVPLGILGAASQSADYFQITANGGSAGGIFKVSSSGVLTTASNIELGHASDTTLSRSAAGVIAVEGVVIPSISSTNTLTNKRVTPRTGTTPSSATPTINTDNVDFYSLTAQTADITSFTTNLSGTPTEGQKLWIAITGTAARAITWGSSFEASTVALPTTTVSTNRLDVGFVWNTVTSKWRCVATC